MSQRTGSNQCHEWIALRAVKDRGRRSGRGCMGLAPARRRRPRLEISGSERRVAEVTRTREPTPRKRYRVWSWQSTSASLGARTLLLLGAAKSQSAQGDGPFGRSRALAAPAGVTNSSGAVAHCAPHDNAGAPRRYPPRIDVADPSVMKARRAGLSEPSHKACTWRLARSRHDAGQARIFSTTA